MAVSDAEIRAFINSGKSEQEIYQAAKQHGVSASQLEGAMGWSSGTVNNWTAQNNVAALAPVPVPTPSPAPISYDYGYSAAPSYVAPTPSPAPVIHPTYTPSWSLPAPTVADRFSDSDVRNWISSAPRSEREIYDAAKQHGVSAAQLERAMGWSSGTVNDWIRRNNVAALEVGQGPNTAYDSGWGGWQPEGSKYWGDNPMPTEYQALIPSLQKNNQDALTAALNIAIDFNKTNGYDPEDSWWVNRIRGGDLRAAVSLLKGQGFDVNETYDYGFPAIRGDLSKANLTVPTFKNPYDPDWEKKKDAARAAAQPASSGLSFSPTPIQTQIPPVQPQQVLSYQPVLNSVVNPATETIEGRVEGLLSGDNPVLRQAADRVRASFASRGLLNSSMAESAAMEAMIAKAIDIAGPDAQRYFQTRTNNVDWANKFASNAQAQEYALQNMAMQHQYNKELASMQQQWRSADKETDFTYSLRNSYLQMTSQANALYQSNVANIQNSQMSAEAKAAALQAAQQLRDNNISQLNATYQAQPGWVASWSVAAA